MIFPDLSSESYSTKCEEGNNLICRLIIALVVHTQANGIVMKHVRMSTFAGHRTRHCHSCTNSTFFQNKSNQDIVEFGIRRNIFNHHNCTRHAVKQHVVKLTSKQSVSLQATHHWRRVNPLQGHLRVINVQIPAHVFIYSNCQNKP